MEFLLDIKIDELTVKIKYTDPILLVGSCFTEHIGDHLAGYKFPVLQNPQGILFDASSVASGILSLVQSKNYQERDLFLMNELWHSWQHHSIFSGMDRDKVLEHINHTRQEGTGFLQNARWLIITLGTSFSYRLEENQLPVANCHRAPARLFNKHLMTIDEINTALDNMLYQLFRFNPHIRVLFTVSPVRHIRDGVVDNNRSKARLIEVVHHLSNKFDRIHYFPAYELVIDVLRDYRFYDIDLVHPNYAATDFVLEKFAAACIDPDALPVMEQVKKLVIASKHKAFQPQTEAHKKFLQSSLEKAQDLQQQFPFLDLSKEIKYFASGFP